jgi:hypothetical protein
MIFVDLTYLVFIIMFIAIVYLSLSLLVARDELQRLKNKLNELSINKQKKVQQEVLE